MTSKQVINLLLVTFVLVVMIYLFKMNNKKSNSNLNNNTEDNSQETFDNEDNEFLRVEDFESMPAPVVAYDNKSYSIGCPIENTDKELKEYYNRVYGTRDMTDRQKAKMALCEHTDFRGKTNASSGQFGPDAVDKINSLYLSGNGAEARNHQGKTIREVYDGLTDQTNLVIRHNIRLPNFEENDCAIANVV